MVAPINAFGKPINPMVGKADFYPVFFFGEDFNGFDQGSCVYLGIPGNKRNKASQNTMIHRLLRCPSRQSPTGGAQVGLPVKLWRLSRSLGG